MFYQSPWGHGDVRSLLELQSAGSCLDERTDIYKQIYETGAERCEQGAEATARGTVCFIWAETQPLSGLISVKTSTQNDLRKILVTSTALFELLSHAKGP